MNGHFHYQHPTLKNENPLDALRLIRSENVGPVTFFQLVSYYGNARNALNAIPELAKRGGSKRPIKASSLADAEKELEAIEKYGARLVLYGQPDYPQALTAIHDAPPVITVFGHSTVWQNRATIGMVGARNASANGCAFARKIATELGQQNYCVASGLARGIDTAAHLGSLATGTVAVIAGGINNIYPPENDKLYKQIAESGAIIAEAPFGTSPMARHFPARNRIIAGMSSGVVVVEASQKSGSLITAHYALDYHRDVFAAPGSPLDPRCKGSNDLIRNGATLTESIHDILQNLQPVEIPPLRENASGGFKEAPATTNEQALETIRALLLEKLGAEPVLLDELLIQCDTTPSLLYRILLELELAGRLQRHSGGRVSLLLDAYGESRVLVE